MTDHCVPATSRPDLSRDELALLGRLLRDHRQVRRDQLAALDLQEQVDGGLGPYERVRTAAVARALLADVEAALDRLGDGSYGWCRRCLAPIPRDRLFALPHVTYCVACGNTG